MDSLEMAMIGIPLATVFLEEKMPELVDALSFDSESGIVFNRIRR